MTQEQIDRHLEISDLLMANAIAEFEIGEEFIASELAWGAVAHYLKSVAKLRDWPNETHRDLNDIARDLAHETDSPETVRYLYSKAGDLHSNFYEDWLSPMDVAISMNDAEEFIRRLENRNRPRPPVRPSRTGRPR